MSKNYSAKLASRTTKKVQRVWPDLPFSPLLDSGHLWEYSFEMERYLEDSNGPASSSSTSNVNPCPRCWFIPPISGASSNNWTPEFQANWNWELFFFLEASFFDDGGCFLCEKKCVVDIWCKSCVFFIIYEHICVCVCVSQFDDPKDEIQGKSLSSRGSEACSHVMNCWDVKRRSPEDVAAVHASTNVSTRDMYMFDIRWINTNPMTYAHK